MGILDGLSQLWRGTPEDFESADSEAVKDDQYADLLKEMHRRWDYATERWQAIRDERETDMQYVSGNPWSDTDRRAREEAGRPVLSFDEFGQYVNQLINEVRQHKRAILVTPIGFGANDHTAEFRQNLIRQIEYRSNAQQAYTAMFENTVQGSYGYLRIKPQYADSPQDSGGAGAAFNQELLVEPLPNPDLVTVDPDIIKPDGSDMKYAWIAESWPLEEYRRKWPHAKVRDFTSQLAKQAPSWLEAEKIRVAEYWEETTDERNLLLFENVPDPQGQPRNWEVFEEDLDEPKWARFRKFKPTKERRVEVPTVTQYMTNGFEVLGKPTVWPGKSIPLVCCFGKTLYVDTGSGPERMILSMVRLARDPGMLLSYYVSSEAELVGMTPKTPAIGYTGQFRGKEPEWQKVNHEPVAFLEANPTTEGTGGQVLPLPQFRTYDPPIQALEVGKESARRAIQAAMGISPLPTSAQRRNDKSGVALQQIRDAEQQGSFHFIDAYEMAITRTGAILNELLDAYYDTARDVTVRTPADEPSVVRINDDQIPQGQDAPIHLGQGQYDVTLSTGPSKDSEHEAASDFADSLMQSPMGPLIADLAVKLKNVGPIGDEIAARLHAMLPPPIQALDKGQEMDPAQAQAIIAQLQQENAQLKPLADDNQAKMQIAQSSDQAKVAIAAHADKTKLDVAGIQGQAAITVAEMKSLRDDVANQIEAFRLLLETEQERRLEAQKGAHQTATHLTGMLHDRQMQAIDHAHELEMAAQQAQHAQDLQAQAPQPDA